MLKYLSRFLVALWFVGMVVVAVRGTPTQGQTPIGDTKYLPLMYHAPLANNPPLREYLGLFMGTQENSSQIYTVRADGRELTQLTYDALAKRSPSWSADGNYIAYVEREPYQPDERLMVMESDGSQPNVVALSDSRMTFEWSPVAGQLLVYLSQGESDQLVLVDVSVGESYLITELPADFDSMYYAPLWGWSPDGRYVHYVKPNSNTDQLELWTMTIADGSHALVGDAFVPQVADDPTFAQWSPDSREILFSTGTESQFKWQAATPDGTAIRTLFEAPYILEGWVLGNSHYLLRNQTTSNLATLAIEGGAISPLTAHMGTIGTVHISPQGDSLLYLETIGNGGSVYWLEVGTGASPIPLVAGCSLKSRCDVYSAAWADDGHSVMFSKITADRDSYSTLFLATLPATSGEALRLVHYRENYWNVEFLPASVGRAFMEETYVTPPYPAPYNDVPFMLDTVNSTVTPFPFANNGLFQFGEWRHEP